MTFDAGRIRHDGALMHYSRASNGSAVASNWRLSATGDTGVVWTPETAGGGSVSYGSNSTDVAEIAIVGTLASVARSDHYHSGVKEISSSSSNTLQRGKVNLRSGTNVGLTATDTDGDGEFDTITIHSTGTASGGGGSGTLTTVEEVDGSPTDSAVTKLVFPNGTLSIVSHVATYTPSGGGGGTGLPAGKLAVQSGTQNGSSNTNSLALTLGSTPTNGNLLILVSGRDDNGTISSITQTNVTWTQIATSTAAPRVEVWKGVVSASAGTGITVAYSTSSFSQYVVTEWNGITGTLDTSAVASGVTTLGSRPRVPSLLPGQTDALVIGGMTTTSNGTQYGPIIAGNLRVPDCELSNTMRMHCVYGFPGQTYAHGIAFESNSGTQSGVLVSLT